MSAADDEVILRGPRAHSVTWMICDDWVQGTVICHASEGADCRMICPKDCESWSLLDHEHELVDSGKCQFVQWMEASDGVLESHVGQHAPVDGFIEPDWDDDHYIWSYVADTETA